MKIILWLLRIIVGVLFIFSGLIKANDPSGLSYKMNEFFEVWNMHFMTEWSMTISVLMIGFEIIAGIGVLIGYGFRTFSLLLLLLTGFFTFLTAYVYLTDKIKECGCFGDCIKISNAETFWKDVVLLAFVIILYLFRKKVQPLFKHNIGTVIMVITTIIAFGVQWYTLNYLPKYDCLAYKKGNNIWEKMQAPPGSTPDVYQNIMIYEKDGVKKEFDETNFPWQDTTWKYVDTKTKLIKKGNAEPVIKDFMLNDYAANDKTEQILKEKGHSFILLIRDVNKANLNNIELIQNLIKEANQANIPFYIASSSSQSSAEQFAKKHHLEGAEWLLIDGTVSKTAMRTNPGLMMLNEGTIIGKWSYMSYPKSLSEVAK
jgi:uncharacterized membrane protein YphA (DoxX/SURF4 family)